MPLEKPKKPTELIPRAFGGIKNNFSDDLQSTGFEPNIPQTYNGDNINYHLDATGKELDYVEKVVDFINQAPVNHIPFVNENNQLDYVNKDELGGGGLEIGDVAFTQMAIDESKGKRRKLNGQIITQEQYQELTNILKASIAQNPDMACTEQEWQAEVAMSIAGVCYKFVVDDIAGTIRLPKYPDYFIGGLSVPSGNIPVVGTGKSMGLMNGTQGGALAQILGGSLFLSAITQGYGENVGKTYTNPTGINNGTVGLTNDQSKSGIIAKLSATKTDQIKGTYFIQVATGAETEDNIINTLELNNPFVLLEPKFFESEVYNASWLLANGSYNGSNAVHPSAYQALLVENNTEVAIGSTVTLPVGTEYTKRGLSVKLSTDSNITNYDFRINTAEETFMLPTKVKLASGKAVVGNGIGLGLTSGSQNACLVFHDGSDPAYYFNNNAFGLPIGSTVANDQMTATANSVLGVTTDATKSGLELSDSNLYLYFYVGETVQNANLVNVGRIEEKVASLIPDNSSVICNYVMQSTRYVDYTLGASGAEYTAPANGYFVVNLQGDNIRIATYPKDAGDTGLLSGVNTKLQTTLTCEKGGKLVIRYSTITTATTIRFYYMKGAV